MNFWAWSAKWGRNGGLGRVHDSGFFVSNTRRLFGNFAMANFHDIWPWHVNRGWNADFGHKFMKSFHSGVICPQNRKSKIGHRHLTQSRLQVTGCTAERYCLLHVVVQGPGSFQYLVNFSLRRTVAELRGVKLPNFRILAYFPHTKPLKRTFRWPTYSPGVTSQNDSDCSMW